MAQKFPPTPAEMEAKIASLKEHNQRLTDTGAALVTELEAVMTENHSLKATIAEKDAIINKQHSIIEQLRAATVQSYTPPPIQMMQGGSSGFSTGLTPDMKKMQMKSASGSSSTDFVPKVGEIVEVANIADPNYNQYFIVKMVGPGTWTWRTGHTTKLEDSGQYLVVRAAVTHSLEEMYEPGVDWNVLNVGINTATYQYPMYIMNKRPQKHMHEYGMVQLTNKTDIKF